MRQLWYRGEGIGLEAGKKASGSSIIIVSGFVSYESRSCGAGRGFYVLGRKGGVCFPPPPWLSLKLQFPFPQQLLPVCLHGNQAKRLICRVPTLELTLELGFQLPFWKPGHYHFLCPLTTSPSHPVGAVGMGPATKTLYTSFINFIHLGKRKRKQPFRQCSHNHW